MAAQQLENVRKMFVEKVTNEVINQLLDDLLEDKIVNDGQRESILEDNQSRADKARGLIDTVKMKGDVASGMMITYLQRRDRTLHSALGLSSGPPAAKAQMEPGCSALVLPATEEFWRGKQKDKKVNYTATKENIKNRVSLLITNIKFTNEKLTRHGAEKDEENMEKLLTALGYQVVKYTNLTAQAMDDALIEFSAHPKLNHTDSVMVVIMSHGKLGAVLGVNSKSGDEKPDEYSIDNIYKRLGSEQCPALINKPKIIIIQACRGEKRGGVLVSDCAKMAEVCEDVAQPGPSLCANEEDSEADALRCVHKEKDFISLLSCTPDTVSYRQREHGSLLIQHTVKVFSTNANQDHIEDLFTKVMRCFEDFSNDNNRQMPTKERCTLTKHFYFFPGL